MCKRKIKQGKSGRGVVAVIDGHWLWRSDMVALESGDMDDVNE